MTGRPKPRGKMTTCGSLLSEWKYLLEWPQTIECPQMTLIGADGEADIVAGYGKIEIRDPQTIEYEMFGVPSDVGSALARFRKASEAIYNVDIFITPRLICADTSGRRFNAGWTSPEVDPQRGGLWRFRGDLVGLTPEMTTNSDVEHATEVIFYIPRHTRANIVLTRFCSERVKLNAVGVDVCFEFDADTSLLTVTSTGSKTLYSPFTENVLGEPLRIMFGQLLYPRLTARIFEGKTMPVQFRSSTHPVRSSDWLALWTGEKVFSDAEGFWQMYAALLSAVANDPPLDQRQGLDPHKLTRHYEELIQASEGSRWVWALTLASTAEAIAGMIYPRGSRNERADFEEIEKLSAHIRKWTGDNNLKSVAVQALDRLKEMTVVRGLLVMRDSGRITKTQYQTWSSVRNSVMHGYLVSPYSSREDDTNVRELVGLVHSLTRCLVGLGE
jgi:hypothetical protein